jgi:hypothetical protein
VKPALYVFSVPGSGAEVFSQWYAKHFSEDAVCPHLDVQAHPAGRLVIRTKDKRRD